MFHSEPVERTASISPKLRDERVSRIVVNHRKTALLGCAAVAVTAALLAAVGCGGSAQSSRGMTSYSGSSSEPGDKARLFTLPADQMATRADRDGSAHIHRPHVASNGGCLLQWIRYDSGDHAGERSGQPHCRYARTEVHRGEPLLYVASPDYSQLLANYLKARDAYALAGQGYLRAKDLYDHSAIAQRDLEVAESAQTQAAADSTRRTSR